MKKYLYSSFLFAAACMLTFTACSSSDDDDNGGTPQENYQNNLFNVTEAVFQNAAMPASTSSDVITGIEVNDQALSSGSNFITVTSSEEYDRFYIGVEGETGYYEIVPTNILANSATRASALYSYIIYLNYGINYNRNITMLIKGRKTNGQITQAYRKTIRYVQTGISGDLTVNLTFSNDKDIDLRLITPSGSEIYYGNRTRTVYDEAGDSTITYGLDHDSNPNCRIDGLKNENIVIPDIAVEPGVYEVHVDMYSNCDRSVATSWQVVVRYKGQLVTNTLPQRTVGENAIASSPTNLATTIESSITDARHNPVWGTYPINAFSGDKTTVMKFQVKQTTRGFVPVIISNYQPTLMDIAKMKDEEEGLNK